MSAASIIEGVPTAPLRDAGVPTRPLRLCYICADYPAFCDGKSGGIGMHTSALAHALAAAGHDVTVLANSTRRETLVDRGVTLQGVPLSSRRQWKLAGLLPVNWMRWSFAADRAARVLNAQRPFDLVVLPDAYGEGFRFAMRPFAPFVVRFGGPASVVQRWDGRDVPILRGIAERWMERLPASRASLLVCASRPFATFISREWKLDPSRFRIVRNPVDVGRFVPMARCPTSGGPVVLFAGHVQPLKGVQDLADAVPIVAGNVPDVRFRIVGNDTKTAPAGGSYRAHLEQRLRQAAALERVEFVPSVPQIELISMYQHCDLFVLPSHNDVYPNAALEAMSCGCPCIVTSTSGVAELVQKADCGRVVPPGNSRALAAAITELLQLPREAREAMGQRARRTIATYCASEVVGGEALSVYREAIATWPAGQRTLA